MKIKDLFFVKKGKGEYREKLSSGSTPLISATNFDNGVIDHVDIDPTFNAPAITVERVTGQAFVQLFDFATVPDDMSVLVPKKPMSLKKLFFISSLINIQKWRYNYSRKLTPTRLKRVKIDLKKFKDEEINLSPRFPKKTKKKKISKLSKMKTFSVTDLFEIDRGDFHALDRLDPGKIPTVSRLDNNNGITGYYKKPTDANLYQKGLLTISTVTGDPFVQLEDFISTDNVLICKPKKQYRRTTIFFIQAMLYLEKWRFSYGRQPYKRIFSNTKIKLPILANGDLDEDFMEKIVTNCYGWKFLEAQFQN